MATTAILSYANRVSFQQFNAAGTLVGGVYTLQIRKMKMKKHVAKIPMTNTESPPGMAEWGQGNQVSNWTAEGIWDIAGNFNAAFTSTMDNKLYVLCTYFVAKPALVGNPLQYQSKAMFEDIETDSEQSEEGSILTFTMSIQVIGGLTEVNTVGNTIYITGA